MPKNPKTFPNVTPPPVVNSQVHPSVVAPPVVQPPASVRLEADLIWEEIADLPIQMFGLPNQTIAQHATPIPVDPSRLFLTIRSSSVLPSLESALAEYGDKMDLVANKVAAASNNFPVNKSRFNVELADRFVIVTRASQPLSPVKK